MANIFQATVHVHVLYCTLLQSFSDFVLPTPTPDIVLFSLCNLEWSQILIYTSTFVETVQF